LRNFSIYPAPPHAGEIRFQLADDTEIDPAIDKVRTVVKADPRVLAEPVPSVLLDRSTAGNGLEIVIGFFTDDDVAGPMKSDLIRAVHAALDTVPGKWVASAA
jgi:small-conductance mechanosensitive channel